MMDQGYATRSAEVKTPLDSAISSLAHHITELRDLMEQHGSRLGPVRRDYNSELVQPLGAQRAEINNSVNAPRPQRSQAVQRVEEMADAVIGVITELTRINNQLDI